MPNEIAFSMIHELTIGLWNVQWASRASKRGRTVEARLRELASDVLCVTEGCADGMSISDHFGMRVVLSSSKNADVATSFKLERADRIVQAE